MSTVRIAKTPVLRIGLALGVAAALSAPAAAQQLADLVITDATNDQLVLFSDLDKLPLPMWHGVKMDLYHQVPDSQFASPMRVMMSSRGCPFKCIFCSARQVSGFKYRAHSADRVVEEFEVSVQRPRRIESPGVSEIAATVTTRLRAEVRRHAR